MSHQAGEALVPFVVGQVIDRAIEPGATGALGAWIVILAVNFAWLSLSWRYGHRAEVRAEQGAAHELRRMVAQRVLHPGGGMEARRTPGELLNIATADTLRSAEVTWVLAGTAGAVVALVVAAIVLLRVSLPLGLLVLLGLPPLLAVMHVLGRPLEDRASHEQSNAARATSIATDLVTGLRVLKGLGAEDAGAARYRAASSQSRVAAVRAARLFAAYGGWATLLTGAFLALVAYVGGRLALSGEIEIGDLVAAVGLTQFLVGPLTRLAFIGAAVARARASAGRVAAVLAEPPAADDGSERLPPISGSSAADGTVSGEVAIERLRAAALRDLTLRVEAGEMVGLVARDPAVARALVQVLARELDPEAGEVRIDGVPAHALALGELRRAVLVAPHDAAIFAGPLIENLAPWTPSAERLEAVAAASAADTVIAELPGGWQNEVTERGRSLSGGQRQRLTLARALVVDAPVLVLHDPTTAVDSVTEARIASGIAELRRGTTTIVLTSSPAILAAADRVVLIEDGRVAAEGTHEALLRTSVAYGEVVI